MTNWPPVREMGGEGRGGGERGGEGSGPTPCNLPTGLSLVGVNECGRVITTTVFHYRLLRASLVSSACLKAENVCVYVCMCVYVCACVFVCVAESRVGLNSLCEQGGGKL